MSANPHSDTIENSSLASRPRSNDTNACQTPQISTLPTLNQAPSHVITPDTSLATEESSNQSPQATQSTTTTTVSNETETQNGLILAKPVIWRVK